MLPGFSPLINTTKGVSMNSCSLSVQVRSKVKILSRMFILPIFTLILHTPDSQQQLYLTVDCKMCSPEKQMSDRFQFQLDSQ